MRRRVIEWPYWLPVIGGARGWYRAGRWQLAAGAAVLGLYRRRPQLHRWR
jgi:hypothetical protein